ncbi:two-component response regulator [Arcticibacter svalbardensis MN12-7]|uniref:Two-component response regulator n=1 Tax=Arcticibacter svalbardensis MN12-7 TaxID=1150600 RepID=R9GQF5_9SPHI|nr:response regulator [Arcticibacter svalbardensis]EOR93760.1 two-component response regulator [Arcticibacter svalbardensis MN12-7]
MQTIKILFVDNNEDDYNLVRDYLTFGISQNFYELTWCNNYKEAINAMLKSFYDLYLIDYNLDNNTGLELLKEALKSNCNEPVIMLTSQENKKIDEQALKNGAANYLIKQQLTTVALERAISYATQQSQNLGKLKQSEHTFRKLFERSKESILITDNNGRVYGANYSAITLLGIAENNLYTINFDTFFQDQYSYMKLMEAIEEQGAANNMIINFVTLLGEIKKCRVSAFSEIPQHGEIVLHYVFLNEILSNAENSLTVNP